MVRRLFTSTVAKKTSSRFSARWYLQVSSVYGAIADLCNEVPKDLRAPWKPAAPDHLETMEIPTGPSGAGPHTNEQQQGNLVQDYERRFEQLSDDQKLSKLCSDAGLKIVETGQHSFTLDTEERNEMQHLCREHNASMRKEDSSERLVSGEYENRSSLGHKSLSPWRSMQYWSSGRISVSRPDSLLGFESWAGLTSAWQIRCKPGRWSIELRGTPLPKQDHDWSPQRRCPPFLFLFMTENG